MWWLAFRDGGFVIIGASSLAHARLLAAANGFGRPSQFVAGGFIDTERVPPIPSEFVGRVLTPIEARQLGEMLNRQPRDEGTERRRGPRPQD